jgi:hypothetical protein
VCHLSASEAEHRSIWIPGTATMGNFLHNPPRNLCIFDPLGVPGLPPERTRRRRQHRLRMKCLCRDGVGSRIRAERRTAPPGTAEEEKRRGQVPQQSDHFPAVSSLHRLICGQPAARPRACRRAKKARHGRRAEGISWKISRRRGSIVAAGSALRNMLRRNNFLPPGLVSLTHNCCPILAAHLRKPLDQLRPLCFGLFTCALTGYASSSVSGAGRSRA